MGLLIMAKTKDLNDLIREAEQNPPQWHGPGVHYSKDGDCLFVNLKPGAYNRVFVDAILTVYESIDDGSLVGFQIKAVTKLMRDALNIKIGIGENPPLVRLLIEGYKLEADGVSTELRGLTYERAITEAARLSKV
jgi:hypothetical protein